MPKFLNNRNAKNIKTLIITFLVSNLGFNQTKIIDKSNFFDTTSIHNGNVKSILVNKKSIDTYSEKKDTMSVLTLFEFSKRRVLNRLVVYDGSIDKEYNIVEFYNNREVKRIFRRENGIMMLLREQFFKKKCTQPFKINEYYGGIITGFYVSTFKNKLLSKREHFINDTLSEWNEYVYDIGKKLIEEKYFSADNPTNQTMQDNGKYSLTFYPEHLIKYSYDKVADTLITIKDRIFIDKREIVKNINYDMHTYEIIKKYKKLKLNEVLETYKTKDSTSSKTTFYDDDGKMRNQYIINEMSNLIIYIHKNNDFGAPERKTITAINTETDNNGNWFKKTYRENGSVTKIITRAIVYYN